MAIKDALGSAASRFKPKPAAGDAFREIHDNQQLGHTELSKMRSATLPRIGTAVVFVLVLMLAWVLIGAILMGKTMVTEGSESSRLYKAELVEAKELGVPLYFKRESRQVGTSALTKDCFFPVDANGVIIDDSVCPRSYGDVKRPDWHKEATKKVFAENGVTKESLIGDNSLKGWLLFSHASMLRALFSLLLAGFAAGIFNFWAMRELQAANLLSDTESLNQHADDQHIMLHKEQFAEFGVFPNRGATSTSEPSSLIGHAMMSNAGVNKVRLMRRYDKDVLDEDGNVEHYRGEPIRDAEGAPIFDLVPMFDEKDGHKFFNSANVPERTKPNLRKFFDPNKVAYNPTKRRDKSGNQATVAERINEDWEFPEYEPARPTGVYFIDEAPVNTMILAMTRAGKGQTYIEPMIDMWLREARPNNIVINDPKGELLVKHYVRATVRGFQVVQFNLIEVLKTDIYNPLAMAAEAARRGDQVKVAAYVEAISDVFFPVEGAQDPMWPTAAGNAFKRTAYGMIDYYMEEERQLRKRGIAENWDAKVLDNKIDEAWGKVTLYNCYQLFVQLSAKKLKDPVIRLNDEVKEGLHGDPANDPDAKEKVDGLLADAREQAELWNGEEEIDMLTLFFNATDRLPLNEMRTEVSNADKSLRAMAGADKMIASVYGIAITAMAFFTDPTISRLTSGALSQNIDLAGLSFPRRFGVRFNQDFITKYNLVGASVRWDCYSDPGFTEKLDGKAFSHNDIFSQEGWAKASLEGKFPGQVAYLRMQLLSAEYGTPIKTFHFRFTKGYKTNLSGRSYVKDPVLGTKIVKDGLFEEMVAGPDGTFVLGSTEFEQERLNVDQLTLDEINSGDNDLIQKVPSTTRAIISLQANYSEQPKAIFLVTPPHLMKYAKLILILLKQLVDLNFDSSYKTKEDQKPLYKTRYMLDELGNLQSEGNGIAGFETMLSIGLGQGQEFTLILQTLQQLRDVYGESVDKIVQGNVANIIFLKSTDDSMIETLVKMTGVTHKTFQNSVSVTEDIRKVGVKTDSKATRQMQLEERPVISYNDFAFLPMCNSIIVSAGKPPIWNRNATALPMSWAMFGGRGEDSVINPGYTYSLQTIPTLSSAKDFDVRLNQPNFFTMVEKRMQQALVAPTAESLFRKAYGFSDFEMSRLDPNLSSSEMMDINDVIVSRKLYDDAVAQRQQSAQSAISDEALEVYGEAPPPPDGSLDIDDIDAGEIPSEEELLEQRGERLAASAEDDREALDTQRQVEQRIKDGAVKRFAEKTVSREMLVDTSSGAPIRQMADEIAVAYHECKGKFTRDSLFIVDDDYTLRIRSTGAVAIRPVSNEEAVRQMAMMSPDKGNRVHMSEEPDPQSFGVESGYWVEDEMFVFLAKQDTWSRIAGGVFDREMARVVRRREE